MESWRRLEGLEAVVRMLDGCKRCVVRVNLREGDVWIQAGEDGGVDDGSLANGGILGPMGWGTQGVWTWCTVGGGMDGLGRGV